MKKLMIALCVVAVAAPMPVLAKGGGGRVHRVKLSSRGGNKRHSFSKGIAVADNGKGRSRSKSVDSWSTMGELGSGRHGKDDIFSFGDSKHTARPRGGFHHHRFG